jgi:antitoxin component of MazEF toxin-antitoxin module
MEATHLHPDDVVDLRVEKGRIAIEPVREKTYKLKDLLKGINSKNLHEIISGGRSAKRCWVMPRSYVPEARDTGRRSS